MSLQKYLLQLKARHGELDNQLKEEMSHRMPDFSVINDLKKKKLRIKDMIEKVTYRLTAVEARVSTS